MAKGHLFWHVPEWFSGPPSVSTGISNVGADIVVDLVNAEQPDGGLAPDNFVVERVIGQYQLVSDATGVDRFVHHRLYVTMGDAATLFLRKLDTADDADTSFMYSRVEFFSAGMHQIASGNWASPDIGRINMPATERNGTFDVRVGRKVMEGTSLIWHTEVDGGPASDTYHLKMWVRILMREA